MNDDGVDRGLPYMTSTHILGFFYPISPLPFCADVICGSPPRGTVQA